MLELPFELDLVKELIAASDIHIRYLNGKATVRELCTLYDNFYYAMVLDGHEASGQEKVILATYSDAIGIHEFLQTKVIDSILPDSLEGSGSSPGRINATGADFLIRSRIDIQFLKELNHRLSHVVQSLMNGVSHLGSSRVYFLLCENVSILTQLFGCSGPRRMYNVE
jgi:hypothetical protein